MNRIITGAENEKFVQLCIQSQVEFLLIGGAAALHYGCRRAEDGIAEIDLLIEPSPLNADKLMAVVTPVLEQAGLKPEFTAKQLQLPKRQLPLKSSRHSYNLDILTPWKEWSYQNLRRRSEVAMLCSTEVRVVSRADLIALKECVVEHLESEAEKHRKDLACLKTGQKGVTEAARLSAP